MLTHCLLCVRNWVYCVRHDTNSNNSSHLLLLTSYQALTFHKLALILFIVWGKFCHSHFIGEEIKACLQLQPSNKWHSGCHIRFVHAFFPNCHTKYVSPQMSITFTRFFLSFGSWRFTYYLIMTVAGIIFLYDVSCLFDILWMEFVFKKSCLWIPWEIIFSVR